jgi:hypothetical protein
MNVLLERLPTVAEIDGREYELNTDFRVCLKIVMAFEDPELTMQEKYLLMVQLLYKDIPENVQRASEIAILFLNCGEQNTEQKNSEDKERVFSFEKDSRYIFSAIQHTHKIDLSNVDYMHWWKFCFLFMELSEDCFFARLVDLRVRKSKGKLTKEEKEYCYKIKDIVDLPVEYTQEEIKTKNKFMELLNG